MHIPLQEWFTQAMAETPNEMLWKGAAGEQVMFARDHLTGLVGSGRTHEEKKHLCHVVGTHTSKSVKLPVYCFDRPDLGLRLIARDNFYDWKLSVISTGCPIACDFGALFKTTPPVEPEYTGNPLAACYFEGFERDLVFGYYEENHARFSASIDGDYAMWTALFLIMKSVGGITAKPWHTRASHEAELALRDPPKDKAKTP